MSKVTKSRRKLPIHSFLPKTAHREDLQTVLRQVIMYDNIGDEHFNYAQDQELSNTMKEEVGGGGGAL